MSSKRQCPDSDGQSPLKKPNVKRMDISLNQDSLLAENDLNTDVEEQPQDITENMEDTDEISDSGAISMDEENGEVDSIKIQNIIKKALMENEKKMDAYKQEMTEEIKTLRSQIQTQTLKMDDMKLRLEMIGIHVPADVTNKLLYKAEFDYKAMDTDEVSIQEGDIIEHPEPVDYGWMMGTVRRTGQRGMLPSNYVKLQSIKCQNCTSINSTGGEPSC